MDCGAVGCGVTTPFSDSFSFSLLSLRLNLMANESLLNFFIPNVIEKISKNTYDYDILIVVLLLNHSLQNNCHVSYLKCHEIALQLQG